MGTQCGWARAARPHRPLPPLQQPHLQRELHPRQRHQGSWGTGTRRPPRPCPPPTTVTHPSPRSPALGSPRLEIWPSSSVRASRPHLSTTMGVPPGQGRARSPLPDLCQLTRCVTGPLHHSGQWGSAPRTPPRLGWLWLPSGGAGPTGSSWARTWGRRASPTAGRGQAAWPSRSASGHCRVEPTTVTSPETGQHPH